MFSACSQPVVVSSSGEVVDKRLATVSGRSEIASAPDQAEIDVSVISKGRTPKEVQEKNAENMNSVINVLKKWGFTDKEVQTGRYDLQQDRRWDPDTNQYVDLGYIITNSVHITAKKLDVVGDILDLVVQNGVNQIERVRFSLSKEKQRNVFDEALKKAAEDAKSKVDVLVKTLGAKIKKVHSIQENNFIIRPYEYEGFALKAMAEVRAPTPIIPEDVETTAQVTVSFELE